MFKIKSTAKKLSSILLATVLSILTTGNFQTTAVTNESVVKLKNEETNDVQLLDECEIPDVISYEEVLEKGHCERVYEKKENLNSFLFNNIDGTQSLYLFEYPVKYVDESGEIKDKSMELEENNTSFVSADSDISTSFSKNLSNGIELEYEDINIKMIPDFISDQSATADLSEDNKNVLYDLENDISLEYSLTYQGFKENIILDEYTGVNEFTFTLLTDGLKLDSDENEQCNLYNKDGNAVASLGNIIIFDSANNTTTGNLSFSEIKVNQEYSITLSVDEGYLADVNTVYPVCIDPTLEINYQNCSNNLYGGELAITHSTVYSDGSTNHNSTMHVGKYGYKKARTLMKFPGLINTVTDNRFLYVDPSQIQSAKVYLRDVGYQQDINAMEVECYQYTKEWNQNLNLNWNDYADSYSNKLSSNVICNSNGMQQETPHTYAFDITSAVKSWCTGLSYMNQAYGILFKSTDSVENGNSSLYASFGSYNQIYYSPYLVIDYTTPYNYMAEENVPVTYTYHTSLNLTAGKTYIFQTEKASSVLTY